MDTELAKAKKKVAELEFLAWRRDKVKDTKTGNLTMSRFELLSNPGTVVEKPGVAFLGGRRYEYVPLTQEEVLQKIKETRELLGDMQSDLEPTWQMNLLYYCYLVVLVIAILIWII